MPFNFLRRSKNIIPYAFVTIAIFFLSACTDSETKEMLQQQDDEIKQLQSELDIINKQLLIINTNQKAIAKKLRSNQQPTIKLGNSASLGDENANVILLEFTDLHCPFCKKFNSQTFPSLSEKYIDKGLLRFVGKHLPIPQLHPNAFFAAELLECLREQSADDESYEKAKSWLFEQNKQFDKSQTDKFSTALNLDNSALTNCLNDGNVSAQIKSDMLLAKKLGIKSTPSFVIGLQKNGHISDWKIITGAKKTEQFSQAIDLYLTMESEEKSKTQ